MAGYTLGFDDGGVIPEDDNAPEAATVEDTLTPNAQSPEQQDAPQENAQEGAQPGFTPGGSGPLAGADFDPSHVPGNVKKIVSYLMGDGAADPQAAKKFEQGVKNEYPGISDDDANLMAVHKASELGGPAAGWAMLQYNRTAYNAKQSFAKAALNGVDGKTGNAQAAALAATQAGQHILDGSSTIFTADPGGAGFTATVKIPGTDRQVGFKLTPEQFNNWLDVGKAGMYDRVMEDGTPAALQKVASQGGAAQQQAPAQDGDGDDQAQPAGPQQAGAPAATPPAAATTPDISEDERHAYQNPYKAPHAQSLDAFPGTDMQFAGNTKQDNATDAARRKRGLFPGDQEAIPGTHDKNGHYIGPKVADPDDEYSPELRVRANKMFPMVGDEKQRQDWMAAQEEKEAERQNRVDVASEKGKNDIEKARQTGASRVDAAAIGSQNRKEGQIGAAGIRGDAARDVAKTNADARTQGYAQRAMQAAAAQASRNANAAATEANKNFRSWLQANGMAATDKQINEAAQKFGVQLPGVAAPQAPAPQTQAPTGQAAPAQTQTPSARPANVPQGAKFYNGKWYTRGPDGSAVPVQ